MLGPRQEAQAALFYEFSLEDHVPQDHLLRSIDRFVDLSSIRAHLADFYSQTGRPSVDPELLIRMLLIGYCFGIGSCTLPGELAPGISTSLTENQAICPLAHSTDPCEWSQMGAWTPAVCAIKL